MRDLLPMSQLRQFDGLWVNANAEGFSPVIQQKLVGAIPVFEQLGVFALIRGIHGFFERAVVAENPQRLS